NGPCGRCRNCSRGRAFLCSGKARMAAIMGMMPDGSTRLSLDGQQVRPYIGIGAFAEYTVVNEPMLVKVAPDAPLDLLALTACGVVTGVGAVLNTAQPGGTTVMVGSPSAAELTIAPQTLFGSRRLMGTQGGDAVPARDLPLLVDLYRRGRLNLEGLVSERVPLDQINEAVAHVRS